MKLFIPLFLLAILLIIATFAGIYRFEHPEKTETQLFLDMMKGKIFYE